MCGGRRRICIRIQMCNANAAGALKMKVLLRCSIDSSIFFEWSVDVWHVKSLEFVLCADKQWEDLQRMHHGIDTLLPFCAVPWYQLNDCFTQLLVSKLPFFSYGPSSTLFLISFGYGRRWSNSEASDPPTIYLDTHCWGFPGMITPLKLNSSPLGKWWFRNLFSFPFWGFGIYFQGASLLWEQ